MAALETRAPRAFAPPVWRYISALRGLLNPLLDRRMDRDPAIAAIVAEAEAMPPRGSA